MQSKIVRLVLNFYFMILVILCHKSTAQSVDTTSTPRHFSGIVTATSNGISLLPNLTLGKPALLCDLSLGRGRWSFDPMLRFAMTGKPWAFIFWWRYKLITSKKFTMGIGAHPSFIFRTVSATPTATGVIDDYLITQRYVAAELSTSYQISKKFGCGVYYLGGRGIDSYASQKTHFVSLRANITNVSLVKNFYVSLFPQMYYLRINDKDGIYATASALFGKRKFPIVLSSIVSRELKSNVGGKPLVWNVGVNYIFQKKYRKMLK